MLAWAFSVSEQHFCPELMEREDWAAGKDFYLDGFTDLTPQERQVVAVIADKCNSLTAALTCDKLEEDEGGAGIFSPARRARRLSSFFLGDMPGFWQNGHQNRGT